MATPKIQSAYRDPTSQTEDIADLLLVTTAGLATDGDAGACYFVYHDGTNDVLVSNLKPLPVSVSGNITVELSAVDNAVLDAIAASAAAIDGKTPALGQALAAASVPVVLPATQITALTPQTNALTDTQLRATAVPVSGTVDLGATDNAVLDAIAASVAAIDAGQLPDGHSVVVTGVATLAEQQTQTTSLGRLVGKYLDFDSGAGTDSVVAIGLVLPADGGAVVGGTAANPIRVDVTGSTTQPVSGTFWQATQPVSVASLPLPTGAATAAAQATLNDAVYTEGDEPGIGDKIIGLAALDSGDTATMRMVVCSPQGELAIATLNPISVLQSGAWAVTADLGATDNAVLDAIAASLNVMDDWDESDRAKVNSIVGQAGVQGGSGAVSANTQRVVLATDVALPAGTNNIGDVDVLSCALPTGAATSAKQDTLNAVVQTGILTKPMLTVGGWSEDDSAYRESTFDDAGRMIVRIGAGIQTDGALESGGNLADIKTAAQLLDDTVYTTATTPVSKVIAIGGADPNDLNNVKAFTIDGGGGGGGINVTFVGDTSPMRTRTEGSVTHNSAAVAALVYPVLGGGYAYAAAPTDVDADGDAVRAWFLRNGAGVINQSFAGVLASTGTGASGTGVQRVVTATDSTIGTVTTVSTVTTCSTVTTLTGSSIAHDSIDSGNPHKIGMKAIAHGTNPTAVAAADRTDLYANRAGIPFVIGGHPNIVTMSARILDSDGAQTNVALVTISSGMKIVVTRISVKADGSNSGPVNCTVGFAAASLATPNTTSGAGILLDHQGIAAGSGSVEGNGSGILGVGADGEDLRYTCEDPAGGALTISVSYYTIES